MLFVFLGKVNTVLPNVTITARFNPNISTRLGTLIRNKAGTNSENTYLEGTNLSVFCWFTSMIVEIFTVAEALIVPG